MTDDPAPRRFALLQGARLAGAFLALGGALAGRGHGLLPTVVSPVLLVLALPVFFGVPFVLARRWKSKQ